MTHCIIVGLGGFCGAVLRYLLGLLPLSASSGFPLKTFFINIAGSFVIGAVAALSAKNSLDPRWTLFLKVGICGGFTTFSSFALEVNDLLARGAEFTAAAYIIFSVLLSVAAVFAAGRIFA